MSEWLAAAQYVLESPNPPVLFSRLQQVVEPVVVAHWQLLLLLGLVLVGSRLLRGRVL